jgi:hypothetical protein
MKLYNRIIIIIIVFLLLLCCKDKINFNSINKEKNVQFNNKYNFIFGRWKNYQINYTDDLKLDESRNIEYVLNNDIEIFYQKDFPEKLFIKNYNKYNDKYIEKFSLYKDNIFVLESYIDINTNKEDFIPTIFDGINYDNVLVIYNDYLISVGITSVGYGPAGLGAIDIFLKNENIPSLTEIKKLPYKPRRYGIIGGYINTIDKYITNDPTGEPGKFENFNLGKIIYFPEGYDVELKSTPSINSETVTTLSLYAVLEQIEKGKFEELQDKKGEWIKFKVNDSGYDSEGWCFSGYLYKNN